VLPSGTPAAQHGKIVRHNVGTLRSTAQHSTAMQAHVLLSDTPAAQHSTAQHRHSTGRVMQTSQAQRSAAQQQCTAQHMCCPLIFLQAHHGSTEEKHGEQRSTAQAQCSRTG
jgi:hypothetical protein